MADTGYKISGFFKFIIMATLVSSSIFFAWYSNELLAEHFNVTMNILFYRSDIDKNVHNIKAIFSLHAEPKTIFRLLLIAPVVLTFGFLMTRNFKGRVLKVGVILTMAAAIFLLAEFLFLVIVYRNPKVKIFFSYDKMFDHNLSYNILAIWQISLCVIYFCFSKKEPAADRDSQSEMSFVTDEECSQEVVKRTD